LQWALKLAHRGSLIVVDNVVREGEIHSLRDAASPLKSDNTLKTNGLGA